MEHLNVHGSILFRLAAFNLWQSQQFLIA